MENIKESREKFHSALWLYVESRMKDKNIESLNRKQEEAIENKYYELIKLINETL